MEGSIPFVYLGVPIFYGKPKSRHLNTLADKILSKFDKWSGSLLSLAGRICLVNSVVASSLVHSMMIYRWPRTLVKRVDKAMRSFVWRGNILKSSQGNVAWSRVCAPYSEGGLGIRDIRAANEAFLYKLAWDIIKEKDKGLSFILQRHSTAEGTEVKYFISSSVWNGLDRIHAALRTDSRWIPGNNNSSVKFWNDNWLGFCIADKIDIPAGDRVALNQDIAAFHLNQTWVLGEHFVHEFPDICEVIVAVRIPREAKDELVWSLHKSRNVTSKTAYNICRSRYPTVSWGAWLWSSFILPSCSTLVWHLIWGKLPTAEVLAGLGVAGPLICVFCRMDVDTMDHIFSSCSFASTIIGRVAGLFGERIDTSFGILDVLLQIMQKDFGLRTARVWRFAWVTSFWILWGARNKVVHSNERPHLERFLVQLIVYVQEINSVDLGFNYNSTSELSYMRRWGLSVVAKPSTSAISVRWIPPSEDFIKINTYDSAVNGRIQGGLYIGTPWVLCWRLLYGKWGKIKRSRRKFWRLWKGL